MPVLRALANERLVHGAAGPYNDINTAGLPNCFGAAAANDIDKVLVKLTTYASANNDLENNYLTSMLQLEDIKGTAATYNALNTQGAEPALQDNALFTNGQLPVDLGLLKGICKIVLKAITT